MKWSSYQRSLHERAKYFCPTRARCDLGLIGTLQKIEKQARLGYADLFLYLRDGLGMTRRTAYDFKAVTLRSMVVPQLDRALREGEITLNRATRLLPVLNVENGDFLIEFARTHTEEEVDLEVARLNPNPRMRTVARAASGDHYRLSMDLGRETHDKLYRARTLLGQKEMDEVLDRVLDEWLDRHDPVRKADRAHARGKASPAPEESPANGRTPLTAEQEHAVNYRDRGRCTFVAMDGKRCSNECWTQFHHVRQVSAGGTNDPNNLTTLCSYHHALVHQFRGAKFSGRPES